MSRLFWEIAVLVILFFMVVCGLSVWWAKHTEKYRNHMKRKGGDNP